jgi:hypothetical protein
MLIEDSIALQKIVIRKPYGFRKKLAMLSRVWKLNDDQKGSIRSLFDSSPPKFVSVFDSEHLSEASFSFWGFVDECRGSALLKFLFLCLRPRSHLCSETSAGRLEVFMTVNLQHLGISRVAFEAWLACLLDTLKFSAGCLFFPKYMNDQMHGCLERIFKGRKPCSNFMSLWNKDLRTLYQRMRFSKHEAQIVLARTGLVFDSDTFIDLFQENQRLKTQLTETATQQNPILDLHSTYGTITILARSPTARWVDLAEP